MCLAMAVSAQADVIFGDLDADNFFPSFVSGNEEGIFLAAAPFVLEEGSNVITDIHWLGFSLDGGDQVLAPDNFLVVIFGDDGTGLPDSTTILFADLPVVTSDVVLDLGQAQIRLYSTFIAPVALTPGTQYHLLIANLFDSDLETEEFPGDDLWFWLFQSEEGQFSFFAPTLSPDWNLSGGDLSFLLTNDIIPEPASMTLLGLGLVGLGFRRFRKTR